MTAVSSTSSSLDYNSYLKLLIAQLKNQDPTSPMDTSAFVSELASFSQIEQSISTNSKLDSLLTSQSVTLADAAIGHTVTSADGQTSGVVTSVKIADSGAVATLDNGDTLTLGSGVTIE